MNESVSMHTIYINAIKFLKGKKINKKLSISKAKLNNITLKTLNFKKLESNENTHKKLYNDIENYQKLKSKPIPKYKINIVNINDLEANINKKSLDFKEWADCSISGDYQFTSTGLRIAKIKDLKKIKSNLKTKNIKLIIDKKGNILPNYAAGGFDYIKGEIVLRDNPSFLSLQHESYHAEQYSTLGKEKYLQQTVLEREEYVYNQIIKNKENFTSNEILEAQRYIYKLRNGGWPPSDWNGFKE